MNLINELQAWLDNGGGLIGELSVSGTAGAYEITHLADREGDSSGLKVHTTPEDARTVSRYDSKGEYRPLRGQRNLTSGWLLRLQNTAEVLKALDAIYPGTIGTWVNRKVLRVVPLRDTLERQTGMYRYAQSISDEGAEKVQADRCKASCMRHILWPLQGTGHETQPFPEAKGWSEIPLVCTEACNMLVADSRKVAKAEFDSK